MTMYAAFLATGHAIALKSIKSGTVKKYLSDIVKFLQNFDSKTDCNVYKTNGTIAYPITCITKELKQYKDVPNQREPWTLQLQTWLEKLCEDEQLDGLVSATRNFFGNGIIAGDRRCKWGQPGFNYNLETPQLNNRGTPYAFMIGNIIFLGPDRSIINPQTSAIQHPQIVFFVDKTYQLQKNGDNDITKLLARNTSYPHLCPVKHWLTITDHFHRLVGKSVTDCPLAIYKDGRNGKVLNICSNN